MKLVFLSADRSPEYINEEVMVPVGLMFSLGKTKSHVRLTPSRHLLETTRISTSKSPSIFGEGLPLLYLTTMHSTNNTNMRNRAGAVLRRRQQSSHPTAMISSAPLGRDMPIYIALKARFSILT